MLARAWALCEQKPNGTDVTAQLETELKRFPELRDELDLIISKVYGIPLESFQGTSWYGLASVLITRARLQQGPNRALAEAASPSV